ncbi:MAG: hypothetical protein EF806_00215 [Candidatus Methanoliparum thermophilum]|uniref:CheR-type methyltransferase domain-containing protein n=1 Tax=Methanoliparum thermophilum TaxID=2491083 RepID=A0A520KU44_METT2|nr:CheR family methyltransferase [Candidatus Methanoliparum sp. LAM-1]RZN65654.1 MAG: hypothetical protein EF806_00215 [Candidatus Methanoliparum thermophilum]
MTMHILSNYLIRITDKYRVKESIAKMVKFKYHNLTNMPFSRFFDLIFCRNVIIYFSPIKKNEVLAKNGFLVLGKTEYIPTDFYSRF